MKIEKLNENKLKITLDINDLKKRNLDVKSFVSNTPESQDLFWDVMQEAEREYGFNVDESMVYVEAHISSTGNFTLIITKSKSAPAPVLHQKIKPTPQSYKLKRKEFSDSFDNVLFEFASIEALRDFIEIANILNYQKVVLYSLNEKFYLLVGNCFDKTILEYSSRVLDKNAILATISEYGKELYKDLDLSKIKESL